MQWIDKIGCMTVDIWAASMGMVAVKFEDREEGWSHHVNDEGQEFVLKDMEVLQRVPQAHSFFSNNREKSVWTYDEW